MSALGNILGVRMNVLIGMGVPLPMPADVLSGIESVEVFLSDKEPSGFTMVVGAGRTGPLELLGPPILMDPRFGKGARVIITMIFDISPSVIFDGIITESRYRPGSGAGQGTLTLMGRDLSVELNREVKQTDHPAMDETMIAAKIALSYPMLGLVPLTVPPKALDVPLPMDRTPQQCCSDWAYLKAMARRHGYETYIDPGPVPGVNTLYWGPPVKSPVPLKTITVNMGPGSDAHDVEISDSAEDLTMVQGFVEDRLTGARIPIFAGMPSQMPLGLVPAGASEFGRTRTVPIPTSGLNGMQALARAQAKVDESAAKVFQVTGTLDSASFNGVLRARDTVALRGVGAKHGGAWKVASVRHVIRPGNYEQGFQLTRSEAGSTLPLVPVMMA